MFEYMTIRELYELAYNGSELEKDAIQYVELQGWVRINRDNGSIGIIELNDGTYFKNAQLVYLKDNNIYELAKKYSTGTALTVMGKLVFTPDGKHPFEIQVKELKLEGKCDDDYPLQKKTDDFETVKNSLHLRPRANTFMAVYRVRSALSMAVHEFFQSQGFLHVNPPVITKNDFEDIKEIYDNQTSLNLSGQFCAETFALAFRDVYTFAPNFNMEKLNMVGDANDFWIIEPEIAFADLEDDMLLAEDLVKYCIDYVFENCKEEMNFLNNMSDYELIEGLKKNADKEFKRMEYTEAIEALKDAVSNGVDFKCKNIYWGMTLEGEHEKYICESIVGAPVFLINHPKETKPFYARVNDDGKTVATCDLLVPFIGKLVCGSQREERYDYLIKRMKEDKMDLETLNWYADLRRFGGCKHAGFAIGFEKFVMYITGVQNIKDVLPFPVVFKKL